MPERLHVKPTSWSLIFAAWLVAASATLGALFFSDVMGITPCVLCWYQRIFMMPLVCILAVGLFPFDLRVARYGLSLAVPGLLVALFHLLLAASIIPPSASPCTQGVPCTEEGIAWFGFVTIPLLSVLAFSTLCALLLASQRVNKP